MHLRHQRAHVGVLGAVADLEGVGALFDLGDQFVGDVADRDQRGDGHAAFAGGAEAGVDHGVGGEVEVGVREDDGVVLGPAECLDAFAVGGAGGVHVLGDGGGADEADGLDGGVGEQFVDGGLVALQDVEHPGRESCFGPEFGHPDRGGRVLLAGLEDDGVAGGDGDGEEPHRDHGGEVERGDDPDGADGLPDGGDVDVGGGVFGHAALEQVGHAAGEFDDFLAAGDLTECVGDDLAVLGGDDLRQLALAGVEQFPELEHDGGTLGEGGVAPGGERGRGGVDDGAGVLDAGQGDLTRHGTSRRVGDRGRVAARTGESLAVGPVCDLASDVGAHVLSFHRVRAM
ncbi:hypothetical protein RW1_075_00110 [Rhodococcus wratislaviensis NBRC 100605]|uniref:Uncharacterized protein n=1 Tax=Rhodococcus wratislaviensis NBRC 100605 TaxID=1219028 RepID=X0QEH3_RHOWR|nr:hypothetical protein RW1_075_00110 [Rhodococcus wratislaviensis NBRC 100605]